MDWRALFHGSAASGLLFLLHAAVIIVTLIWLPSTSEQGSQLSRNADQASLGLGIRGSGILAEKLDKNTQNVDSPVGKADQALCALDANLGATTEKLENNNVLKVLDAMLREEALSSNYAIKSKRLILPNHEEPVSGWIVIDGNSGKIQSVHDGSQEAAPENSITVIDVGDLVVMPGLIDPHVHMNEPGRTEWEGFETATKAAAAGGTTTVFDMPLNCVPSTVDIPSLCVKLSSMAASKLWVDVGILGGIIPSSLNSIVKMAQEGGVVAFKSFMVDSQNAEFPNVNLSTMHEAMNILSHHLMSKYVYMLHAELPPSNYDSSVPYPGSDTSYIDYVNSRPDQWEVDAVIEAIKSSIATKCATHIVHVSSSYAADIIRAARALGAPVTSETCTQYLLFKSEEIPDGATSYKCAPPIRSNQNRLNLWSHILQDPIRLPSIDMVTSDHSPALPSLKQVETGNIRKAWGGISGVQHRLIGTWTAAKQLNVSLSTLSNILSTKPAQVFGISNMKGSLAPNMDADLVIWNPDELTKVTEHSFYARHKVSPFLTHPGPGFQGRVYATLVRGAVAYTAWEDNEDYCRQECSAESKDAACEEKAVSLTAQGKLITRTAKGTDLIRPADHAKTLACSKTE